MIGNIKAKGLSITGSRKTGGLQASKDRETLITLITLRPSEELGEVLSGSAQMRCLSSELTLPVCSAPRFLFSVEAASDWPPGLAGVHSVGGLGRRRKGSGEMFWAHLWSGQ